MSTKMRIIAGVGSPVMDLSANVTDEFIETHDEVKSGIELVDDDGMLKLLDKVEGTLKSTAGGSAANTLFALARLGAACGFIGKLGKDDSGREYIKQFEKFGGNTKGFKYCEVGSTARCLSLVTPDFERTMRTCLGAAANLKPDEIQISDFEGYDCVHIEGYLLFNQELALAVLKNAKAAGCTISLDLGSFEIVKAYHSELKTLLNDYVDIVFANEDEAFAFSGTEDPQKALEDLSRYCEIAVVKLGAEGALIKDSETHEEIAVIPVTDVVDTTGAGDYWAAGFLYGYINDYPLSVCGQMGSILGAEVVQQLGADLPDDRWEAVVEQFEKIVKN
mgnify:CR=1 FL=1